MQCRKSQRNRAASLKILVLLCMSLSAVQQPNSVVAIDDVANVSPCELESIINQLINPGPEYQMHANALRNQLRNILRDKQLEQGEEQSLDYDYMEEDKRSVAALAAQGLLNAGPKRSLANLAKNGQLPTTTEPEGNDDTEKDKRYVGALARSGGYMGYGKRNVGTLARDFQLPQNGKRNLATLARQGLLSGNREAKRNVAAVARYNSMRMAPQGDKRNIGALKASPVHGAQHKRDNEEYILPAAMPNMDMDYAEYVPNYYMFPSYADMDWGDFGRAQKRFLDTSKDPELFGIENGSLLDAKDSPFDENFEPIYQAPQKRHIGSVYRSGFLPSYRYLRSPVGGGSRFSRSGRAKQFVEYFPQPELLRQPTAAACKRCFLTYRPSSWGAAGIRGRLTKFLAEDETEKSINTNALPTYTYQRKATPVYHSWGTHPRVTALLRRTTRPSPNFGFDHYNDNDNGIDNTFDNNTY